MFTPTRGVELHLSTKADLFQEDAGVLQATLEEVKPINKKLQELREHALMDNRSVFDIDIEDAVNEVGGSGLPQQKLDEIENINNIKWRQFFDAVLSGEQPSEALDTYRGDESASTKHLRISPEQIDITGNNELRVPVGGGHLRVKPDEPVTTDGYQFDELVIEQEGRGMSTNTTTGSTSGTVRVSLNFVNDTHPRDYAEAVSTTKTKSDANYIRENPTKQSIIQILASSEYYSDSTTRDLLLFLEGYIPAVRLPADTDSPVEPTRALCEVAATDWAHIPQSGSIILSHNQIDLDVESEFPEKQDLTDAEKHEIKEHLDYPTELSDGENGLRQVGTLAQMKHTGAINEEEVEYYNLCWWTPYTTSEESAVYEAITTGQEIESVLQGIDTTHNISLGNELLQSLKSR